MTQPDVIVLSKPGETYVFIVGGPQQRVTALLTFLRFADRPDLSFTCQDAERCARELMEKVRQDVVKVKVADA